MRTLLSCLLGLAISLAGGFSRAQAASAPPLLVLSRTHVTIAPGAEATLLDEAALVSDPDSPNFDAGTLTVEFVAGGSPEDRLGIRNLGAGPGNIFVSGHTVSYSIQPIGIFNGGTNGAAPLVITLNGKATAEAVQALARSITYENVTATSPPATRLVRWVLTDGDGGVSAPVFLSIDVRPANTPPVAIARISPLCFLTTQSSKGVVISPNNSNALVVLDGSFSSDEDHDALRFSWFEDESAVPFASAPIVTNTLAVGSHLIHLLVSDGLAAAETTVSLEVVTAGSAVEQIIERLARSDLSRHRARPFLATLKSAVASFEHDHFKAGRKKLEAFQDKVRVQIARHEPALAAELVLAAEKILDAVR